MKKPVFGVSSTNRAVKPQNMARGLRFRIKEEEGLYYVAKTKVVISCVVTAQLICTFVFDYAKSRFSHDSAHFMRSISNHTAFTIYLCKIVRLSWSFVSCFICMYINIFVKV